jgi:hypothetical protein
MMDRNERSLIAWIGITIVLLLVLAGILVATGVIGGNGELPAAGTKEPEEAASVGVEVYDLSMYDESYQQYMEALGQMEEDWFPRQAIVQPKGPEGGEFPNAPLSIYDAYPGQEAFTENGERYTITRTWIGDIAVGTEVTLEGVVGQGEWCFVTAETIGGWSSSGWVWCYRLFVPE